jgi:nuclear GTP-binding protein
MQAVQLDSKIKLLDSPGIVFASSQGGAHADAVAALKNAVRTDSLSDPIIAATAVLQRGNKQEVAETFQCQSFGCVRSNAGYNVSFSSFHESASFGSEYPH